jgi:hypothetical protein
VPVFREFAAGSKITLNYALAPPLSESRLDRLMLLPNHPVDIIGVALDDPDDFL